MSLSNSAVLNNKAIIFLLASGCLTDFICEFVRFHINVIRQKYEVVSASDGGWMWDEPRGGAKADVGYCICIWVFG